MIHHRNSDHRTRRDSRAAGRLRCGVVVPGLPAVALTALLMGALWSSSCGAVAFTSLISFGNTNGARPYAALVQGTNGNFYGTTSAGGNYGFGTVFELTTNGVLTMLHSFAGATDGAAPQAGLIFASDGNFYGTTSGGGKNGDGTVFEVTSNGTFVSLATFDGTNGMTPWAALVQGTNGSFYGTTSAGGTNGLGTVFQLSGGVLSALFSFGGTNGSSPSGALVQGQDGNFYGTTAGGGASGSGTIFRIALGGSFTNLYSFSAANGPQAGLMLGTNGSFYGTTAGGGTNGQGTVFQFAPLASVTTLFSFAGTNGAQPFAALVQGANGNLYGTTSAGGTNDAGTIFSLSTVGTLTTLYSFRGGNDGANPQAALVQGIDGNFYGTATGGGRSANGTIYQLSGFPPFIISQPVSQTIPGGTSVQFSVSAGGPGPLNFQWQLNSNNLTDGGAIVGATSTNLSINNATTSNAGTNWVIVRNPAGSVTSSPAILTVVNPPTVAITSPSPNARLQQSVITMTGKANDNVAVARVYYQLGGAGWNLATTANGWSNWSAKVTLPPGSNTAQAYAVNILGISSATNSVGFFCTITSAPVVVQINGAGRLSPNYNGQPLTIGKTFAMTAIPAAGFVFSNWTGGTTGLAVLTTSTRLSFVMSDGLLLEANLATNLFSAVSGSHSGLFFDQTNGVSARSSGAFTVTTTSRGTFSGSLQMGSGHYPMRGQFDATGNAQVTVARGKANPLTAMLSLDLTQGTDEVTGTLSDGTWTAQLAGNHAVFDASANPAPFAGSYTISIPGVSGSTFEPAGDGSGAVSVDASGRIRFSGFLADGTRVNQTAMISRSGQWPLYLSLYGGQGSLLGWINLTNGAPPSLAGNITWIKPSLATARYYPAGFALQSSVLGSTFVRPSTGGGILSFTNAAVVLSGGDLTQSITNLVTLGDTSRVSSADGNLRLNFSFSTGSFGGSAANAGAGKSFTIEGVVLQNQNIGRGSFLGPDQSGEVVIFGF